LVGFKVEYVLSGRPRAQSTSPGRGKHFFLLRVVQTGSEVHATSYPVGTGGSFPGVKRSGCEPDHTPPDSAEVKKTWIYTSTPPFTFTA
jgi:hypothetical protein